MTATTIPLSRARRAAATTAPAPVGQPRAAYLRLEDVISTTTEATFERWARRIFWALVALSIAGVAIAAAVVLT